MRVVGVPFHLETLAQIELVREWMAARNVLVIEPAKEPFLMRKLQELAPKPHIAPEPGRGRRA